MTTPAPAPVHVRRVCDLAYVIQAEAAHNRIVKVGRSGNPLLRVSGIRSSVPFAVELIAILSDGARREAEMKTLLRDKKVKGEWFEADDRLNSYLQRARNENAVMQRSKVDEQYFSEHIRPLVLDYLNGRATLKNAAGDFVFRYLHEGYRALEGRQMNLLEACPKMITPEVLSGYLPIGLGDAAPSIFVPARIELSGAAA